jgi:hypothetical protein
MRLVPKAVAAAIASLGRLAVPFSGAGREFRLDEVRGPRTARGLALPVSFDTGLANLGREHPHAMYGMPSPWLWHSYFNDFDTLAEFNGITDTATWDVHAAGAGTFALADGDGGLGLITNAALDNDGVFLQKKGESFRYEAGKPMVFGARLKVSDATLSDFIAGLVITDTTPLDVTDGIFFQKDAADALLDFHVEKNNVATDATALATVVANTFVTMQWAYDGAGKIFYGVNGVTKGSVALTNVPDDEDLTVSFGIQNGEGAAKTMTIDYIFAAKYMGRA